MSPHITHYPILTQLIKGSSQAPLPGDKSHGRRSVNTKLFNSFNATRRCIVDIVSSICATRRCIVDIVSPSCATPRCIVDMRTNVSFATGGPDMKLFKFPMGDNSKWKSCLLRKCTFSIVIILRSIIIAFFRKRTLVSIVNKQWTHPPRNRLVVLLGLDASY